MRKIIEKAYYAKDISGVYWCTRALKIPKVTYLPIADHHFITFICSYEQVNAFLEICQEKDINIRKKSFKKIVFNNSNEEDEIEIYVRTIGVKKNSEHGYIEIYHNNQRDFEVISKLRDPLIDYKVIQSLPGDIEKFFQMLSSKLQDWCEGHWISPLKKYKSFLELMMDIEERVENFIKHYEGGDTIEYSLVEKNCATFVNSLLKVLGYPKDEREELGEFTFIDWAEENLIPQRFFEKPIYIGNTYSKELHIPTCYWAKKIVHKKVIFNSISDALKNGYNGCYFCLRKFDTG